MLPTCCRKARAAALRQLELLSASASSSIAPAPFLLPSFYLPLPPPATLVHDRSRAAAYSSDSQHGRSSRDHFEPTSSFFSSSPPSSESSYHNAVASTSKLPLPSSLERQQKRSFHSAASSGRAALQRKPVVPENDRVERIPKTVPPQDTRPKHVPPAAPPPPSFAQSSATSPLTEPGLGPLTSSRSTLLRQIRAAQSIASLADLVRLRHRIWYVGRTTDSAVIIALVQAFIFCGDVDAGRKALYGALALMKKAGVSDKTRATTVEGCIGPLVKVREDWISVERFTADAVKSDVVSPLLLQRRIKALATMGRDVPLLATFRLFEEMRWEPDQESWDYLVRAYLDLGELGKAHEALERKGRVGLKTTAGTVLKLLDGMVKFGGSREMEEKVLLGREEGRGAELLRDRNALMQDVRVLNKIMSVRAVREDVDSALQLIDYYDWSAFPDPLPSFTPPTTSRTPEVRSAPPPSHTMWWWRPSPDSATFATLISIALRRRLPATALLLFHQSQRHGLPLSDQLLRAIISILLMVYPSRVAVTFVLALPFGQAVVGQRKLPRTIPGKEVHLALLRGVLADRGVKGGVDLVHALSEKVDVDGLRMLDAVLSYVALHPGQKQAAGLPFLLASVKKLAGEEGSDERQSREVVNATLKAAWLNGRFATPLKRSRERRRAIQEQKAKSRAHLRRPSASTPPAADASPSPSETSASLLSPSFALRKELSDLNLLHDRETVQHVLRNDSAFDRVDDLWLFVQQELSDRGIIPDRRHITAIMRAQLNAGDLSGARSTVERAIALGVPRHVSFYSVLLGGASRLGQLRTCEALYAEMQDFGLRPDRPMYLALGMACARRGDVAGLTKVVNDGQVNLHPPLSDLDPVVLSLFYRAFSARPSSRSLLDAQQLVARKLAEGVKPDLALYKALDRTKRWLRRRKNRSAGIVGRSTWMRVSALNSRLWTYVRRRLRATSGEETNLRVPLVAAVRGRLVTSGGQSVGRPKRRNRATLRRNDLYRKKAEKKAGGEVVGNLEYQKRRGALQ